MSPASPVANYTVGLEARFGSRNILYTVFLYSNMLNKRFSKIRLVLVSIPFRAGECSLGDAQNFLAQPIAFSNKTKIDWCKNSQDVNLTDFTVTQCISGSDSGNNHEGIQNRW